MTPCLGRAPCRWTRSKRRSMRGSPPKRREPESLFLGRGRLLDGLGAFFASTADHLLHTAGVAGRADGRAALNARAAGALDAAGLACPRRALLQRSAFTKALGDAV